MIEYPDVKLNFGLRVLRKRPDGYHDLETVFVRYPRIHDTLEIVTADDYGRTVASLGARYSEEEGTLAQAISPDGSLMMTVARAEGVGWNPLDDLCAKAYMLLKQDFDLPSVKIFLEKTSPVGAGLGGGSADGAFTLKMLDSLFSLGLSVEQLASYAAVLGSDCAFFVYDGPMYALGRGEILSPVDLGGVLDGMRIEVVVPEGISVSTAEAYRGIVPRCLRGGGRSFGPDGPQDDRKGPQEENGSAGGEGEEKLTEVLRHPVNEWKDLLVNDFEATVFPLHPELPAIRQSLYDSGALYASMSGSGSALFAIYQES